MFSLVSLSKSKFPTCVALVSHSCRSRSTRVALLSHSCHTYVARVSLVLYYSCCTRVACVALVSHSCRSCGARVYNQFHNILRHFDVLTNFAFTVSETMHDYYL